MLEESLLGVGTVLRLERDALSMAKRLRQATDEYAPPRHCFTPRLDPFLDDKEMLCIASSSYRSHQVKHVLDPADHEG